MDLVLFLYDVVEDGKGVHGKSDVDSPFWTVSYVCCFFFCEKPHFVRTARQQNSYYTTTYQAYMPHHV
jgi:hypothetical protein